MAGPPNPFENALSFSTNSSSCSAFLRASAIMEANTLCCFLTFFLVSFLRNLEGVVVLVTNVSGKPVDLVVCVKVGGVYVFCTCLLPYSRSRICEMTPALSNLSGAAAAGWGVGTLGRGPCFGWSDGPVAEVFLCCDRNLEVLRVVVVVVFDVVVVAPGS